MGFGAILFKIRYRKRQINYEGVLGVVGGLKNPLQNALSGRRSWVQQKYTRTFFKTIAINSVTDFSTRFINLKHIFFKTACVMEIFI